MNTLSNEIISLVLEKLVELDGVFVKGMTAEKIIKKLSDSEKPEAKLPEGWTTTKVTNLCRSLIKHKGKTINPFTSRPNENTKGMVIAKFGEYAMCAPKAKEGELKAVIAWAENNPIYFLGLDGFEKEKFVFSK